MRQFNFNAAAPSANPSRGRYGADVRTLIAQARDGQWVDVPCDDVKDLEGFRNAIRRAARKDSTLFISTAKESDTLLKVRVDHSETEPADEDETQVA